MVGRPRCAQNDGMNLSTEDIPFIIQEARVIPSDDEVEGGF